MLNRELQWDCQFIIMTVKNQFALEKQTKRKTTTLKSLTSFSFSYFTLHKKTLAI